MTKQRKEVRENGSTGRRLTFWLSLAGLLAALTAGVIIALAGFGNRLGLWNFRTGFDMLRWGAWCALAAVVLSLAGGWWSKRSRQWWGLVIACTGIIAGLLLFTGPFGWQLKARRFPPIHDITTDISNPPKFVTILLLRRIAPNPPEYGGPEVAIQQRAAYPDIKTAVLNLPREEAFEQAVAAARALGWEIVAEAPAEGRIEATDTTFWFGFKDDIVIRVTAAEVRRSLVDVRSVSRVGRGDAGTNAKRIRAYLQRLSSQ